jgi:hypothetical protein
MQTEILRLLRKYNGPVDLSYMAVQLKRNESDIVVAIGRMPKIVKIENGQVSFR